MESVKSTDAVKISANDVTEN